MSAMSQLAYRALTPVGLRISRRYDPVRQAALLLRGVDVRTIVDGGAYIGKMTQSLLRHFPGTTVHAFEPQPDTFAKLRANLDGISNVRLHECALSDHDGEACLHINADPWTSSLLAAASINFKPVTTRKVAVRSLDSVLAEADCEGAEVVKLDLQGHELAALRGAERSLDRCHALLIELNFRPRYDHCSRFEEVAGLIGNLGLRLHRFYDIASSDQDHGWLHCDALFIRPRHA